MAFNRERTLRDLVQLAIGPNACPERGLWTRK
jgi:hypothetical protein